MKRNDYKSIKVNSYAKHIKTRARDIQEGYPNERLLDDPLNNVSYSVWVWEYVKRVAKNKYASCIEYEV